MDTKVGVKHHHF